MVLQGIIGVSNKRSTLRVIARRGETVRIGGAGTFVAKCTRPHVRLDFVGRTVHAQGVVAGRQGTPTVRDSQGFAIIVHNNLGRR